MWARALLPNSRTIEKGPSSYAEHPSMVNYENYSTAWKTEEQ